jgi:hypothetical protein
MSESTCHSVRGLERVPGCLNIIRIDSAMAFAVATRRDLPMRQQAAARIETAYDEIIAT